MSSLWVVSSESTCRAKGLGYRWKIAWATCATAQGNFIFQGTGYRVSQDTGHPDIWLSHRPFIFISLVCINTGIKKCEVTTLLLDTPV